MNHYAFWKKFGLVAVLVHLAVLALGLVLLRNAEAQDRRAMAAMEEAARQPGVSAEAGAELEARLQHHRRAVFRSRVPLIFSAVALIASFALMRGASQRAQEAARPTGRHRNYEALARSPIARYDTFWPRVGAVLLDGCLLMPILWLLGQLALLRPGLVTPSMVLSVVGPYVYQALLLARFGQTPGKWLCRVVVRNVDEQPLRTWQAWARPALPILITRLDHALFALASAAGLTVPHGLKPGYLGLGWNAADLLVLLLHPKRRALHDLVVSTVVVRSL